MTIETQTPDHVLETVRRIAQGVEGEHVSIDAFSSGLGRRGYGLLLFALNLPNLIPLPLPIISMLLGLPLAFVGLQLLLGAPHPWLPKALRDKGIPKSDLLHFCDRVDERYGWIHKLVRPRMVTLVSPLFVRLIGAAIFTMAAVMVMPIPLGNLVLAIPIALLSLALVEKDGVFVLAGFVCGGIGLLINLLIGLSILVAGLKAVGHLFG